MGSRAFLQQKQIALDGQGEGDDQSSEILVASNGQYAGTIWIADTLRPEAHAAVRALQAMGLHTALLTGDAKSVALAIAQEVGIDAVHAEVLPHEKDAMIKQLISEGRKVAMVGDGINDAPALMQATVGIAMGIRYRGRAREREYHVDWQRPARLVDTIKISHRCHRIIMQNFRGTLAVDGIGVALAAFGLLNPLFAAFIHVASELTFILNSARLLPGTREL